MKHPNKEVACKSYGKRHGGFTSGPGSSVACAADVIAELPKIIELFNIKTIFDAPCGNWEWMKEVTLSNDIVYVGGDIVPDLIERNNREFGERFIEFDVITEVPKVYDLIICRDCLIHFREDWIERTLQNFKDSGSKYLLTTTFPRTKVRTAKELDAQWHPINVELYGLSNPVYSFPETHPRCKNRYMNLYEL